MPAMPIYYYIIYQVTNKVNNKFYIGQHKTCNLNDGYMGSGKALHRAFKKHGRENFVKEVLFIFDNFKDMNQKEIELVTEEFISRYDTYNCKTGGSNGIFRHTEESKHKMSIAQTGNIKSNETKKKISISKNGKAGKPHSNEAKKKISNAAKGRKNSEESKQKLSAAKMGKTHSEDTKLKMSRASKGKPKSEETKRNMCKPKSEEHKRNMSTARSGTIWITDGNNNKRIPGNLDIPTGFWRGITRKYPLFSL